MEEERPSLTFPVLSIQSIVIEGSNEPVLPFLTVVLKLRFSYWMGGSDPAREKTIELAPAATRSAGSVQNQLSSQKKEGGLK